jgi:predicted phosphoribosyltransferase
MALYADRADAGRQLAGHLSHLAGRDDLLVLGLPRGGVPVAYEVAQALGAPLDVFVVRKLGTPGHEELAMGAIATGGVRVLNREVVDGLRIPQNQVDAVTEREQRELARREQAYRDRRPSPEVRGRVAILIDDGLATGASMHAAIQALRRLEPARLIVAVPTAAEETCDRLQPLVDEMVCATTPRPFHAVGASYAEFEQVSDDQVRRLLAQAATSRGDTRSLGR